ncbi:short-chain dehydrogenase reductase 3b-like [Arachis stenosperma]|uniref:short-chain dehydrogenase reductase 3b-like n=1 Tax=Arachis stenosperma TaxID=217475 RepID=UPI0025AD6111|nr:short-chain dehydrogenase reductase 3b-like [Arachis stenosperma]
MSKQRLEGKVAIVTGGASGIGAEAVRVFVENGAFVVVADVQDELGHHLASSIGLLEKVSYCHCDIRDEKQVEETVAFAVEKYGSLDIMFSNAGIAGSIFSNILDLDLNDFDNAMAVNLRGAAACIKHAARVMVARRTRGSIICTASVAASVGIGAAAGVGYTASKHGLIGLVRSACGELGGYGIRVNSVSPYIVATPLVCRALDVEASEVESAGGVGANLQGIVLKPIHVAEAALFLASDESAYISGHDLTVDGGFLAVNRGIEPSLASLKKTK